jgi:hypothetical protein
MEPSSITPKTKRIVNIRYCSDEYTDQEMRIFKIEKLNE